MAYAPRVLIVEDEVAVRVLFEAVLSQDGYSVTAVGTGRHALYVLRDKSFDIVIVDMSLPDGDGPDVIRQILEEHPHIKALAISGAMEGPLNRLASRAGALATIQKPVSSQALQMAVYRLLDPSGSWFGTS